MIECLGGARPPATLGAGRDDYFRSRNFRNADRSSSWALARI